MPFLCWSLLPYHLRLYFHTRILIETEDLSPQRPRWETVEGGGLHHRGLCEEYENLFYQNTLFIGDSGRYVKEGSRNGHFSLWGPRWGNWRRGSFYRGLWRKGLWETYNGRPWKRKYLFYRAPDGETKALSKGGLGQFVCMTRQLSLNPYPTAFPYGNGMVLHFYQQQESSTTKTEHRVINKGLKTYV